MAATRTTPDLTFLGQLTTTFTPVPTCFQHLYYLLPEFDVVNGTSFRGLSASAPILGWNTQLECYPPALSSGTQILGWMNLNLGYYSPGVCPSGYSTRCAEQTELLRPHQTGVLCCPSHFSCIDPTGTDWVIDWCTSHIRTGTVATGAIIEETTTTVSNTETTKTVIITEKPSTVTVRPTLADGSFNAALATVVRIRWGEEPKTSHITVIAITVPIVVVFLTLAIILFVRWRRHRAPAGSIIQDGPELDAEDSRVNEIAGVEHTPVRHELDGELEAIESEPVEREVVLEPEQIRLERLRGVSNTGRVARLSTAELLDGLTRPEAEGESIWLTESGHPVGGPGHEVV